MRTYSHKDGFTLVELLSVVTIVSILIALIFPAIWQSWERGRRISCMSNMKQLVHAAMIYSTDYNDHFPYCGWGWGMGMDDEEGICWMDALLPYIQYQKELFICPADENPGDQGLYCWAGQTTVTQCSYAMNESVVGCDNSANWEGGSGTDVGRLKGFIPPIQAPEQVLLFIDADYLWINAQNRSTFINRAISHHGIGATCSFCDGHSEWVQTEKLETVRTDPLPNYP